MMATTMTATNHDCNCHSNDGYKPWQL